VTARRCTGTTRRGTPCKATPRGDTGLCNAHSPKKIQDSAGFGGPQPGAGRPRKPRVVDVIRERIEGDMEPVIAALVDALFADRGVVVGAGESAELELIPDHAARIAAARELLDRAYGKAKQQTEVTGADGEPIDFGAADSGLDLRKLSNEQLEQLQRLVDRASPER
jgi:hypothetical protein